DLGLLLPPPAHVGAVRRPAAARRAHPRAARTAGDAPQPAGGRSADQGRWLRAPADDRTRSSPALL
ncbi:MAG: hypothetical protein AVDCRST_MAG16-1157, partial [uncultured Frankineae bacterium]